MRKVHFQDLGLIPYADAWALQKSIFQETIDLKIANRKLPESEHVPTRPLLFCEHTHVYIRKKW